MPYFILYLHFKLHSNSPLLHSARLSISQRPNMAKSLLKLTAVLSLLLLLLLLLPLTLHSQRISFSTDDIEDEEESEEEEEEYVLDNLVSPSFVSRSRFLARVIKKGTRCDYITYNICNGISAKKGKGLLFCCKRHCRNVLSDKNNCGWCGHKCRHGELCCNGVCTDVCYNVHHCGKCNKRCSVAVPCENGFCGYA